MSPLEWIGSFGYAAVAIACLLEGETVLVLAGFVASRGHLDFGAVVAIAAVCGFAGDQFYYWLGRRHGAAVLARWPSVAAHAPRVHALLERWDTGVIVGVRFAYGLRIAGPILIGTSRIPPWRFAVFNALGAALWAPLVAGIGWLFGEAAEALIEEIHRVEGWLLLALVGGALVVFAVRWWRARR